MEVVAGGELVEELLRGDVDERGGARASREVGAEPRVAPAEEPLDVQRRPDPGAEGEQEREAELEEQDDRAHGSA